MECIIPGQNLRVLARALQSLSKIGDELYVEAKAEKFYLISVNSAKTICCQFHFMDNFFSTYVVKNDEVFCKIHMKIVLPLFRGNLDKKLDYFKMELSDTDGDFIFFKMKYNSDDIVMTHKVRLMNAEKLSIQVNRESDSKIGAPSIFFNQLLSMFNTNDDECTMEFSTRKLIVRNYCVGAPRKPKSLRSQVDLNAVDFNIFSIVEDSTINFSLKPLRTAIHFAEGFGLDIAFNFQKGEKPLVITMKHPTFEVDFIVATFEPSAQESQIIVKNNNNGKQNNLTAEDIEAIASEDWLGLEFNQEKQDNAKRVDDDDDDVQRSPMTKRARTVFGCCGDSPYHQTQIAGKVLAEASESEED